MNQGQVLQNTEISRPSYSPCLEQNETTLGLLKRGLNLQLDLHYNPLS